MEGNRQKKKYSLKAGTRINRNFDIKLNEI